MGVLYTHALQWEGGQACATRTQNKPNAIHVLLIVWGRVCGYSNGHTCMGPCIHACNGAGYEAAHAWGRAGGSSAVFLHQNLESTSTCTHKEALFQRKAVSSYQNKKHALPRESNARSFMTHISGPAAARGRQAEPGRARGGEGSAHAHGAEGAFAVVGLHPHSA